MSVESCLDLTTLERWPVQPLIPGDIPVAGQFNPIPVAGVLNQIPVAGEFNPMQVVDVNTTNSARVAYHCIITIGKCSHTPAFRGRSLFSAQQQSRGSVTNNKFQVEKHSTNS